MVPINVLLLSLGHVLPPAGPVPCSVGELRHQSSGYQYRVERIAEFVDSAEVIVRVRAAYSTEIEEGPGRVSTSIHFQILETLRGARTDSSIVLPGRLVDQDDFNRLPVPYQMVRPSGQRGWCFTRDYRHNREYLLLLKSARGRLTTEWMPLAPLNEQVQGADDEWVRWVRAVAHARDRATRQRLLSKPEAPAPYVALRLVVPEAMPDAERAAHGDSTIFLARRPFLSDEDLVRVTTHPRAGEPLAIRVHCRPVACERLAGLTASVIGRSLALVIDSRVRSVSPIMSSVGTGGSLLVQTGATGTDAERIIREIRSRWPQQ